VSRTSGQVFPVDSRVAQSEESEGARVDKPSSSDHRVSTLPDVQQTLSENQDELGRPQIEAWDEWYEAVRESPDVDVRMQAVELWAQQPSHMRDQLASALLDEDEAVRERAEELYEQQLEGEEMESVNDEVSAEPVE